MKKFLKDCVANLKSNLLLLISAFALIIINYQSEELVVCQVISAVLVFITFSRINDIFGKTKNCKKFLKVFSIIATVGIVYFIGNSLYNNYLINQNSFSFTSKEISKLIYVGMAISGFCVYTLITLLYGYLARLFSDVFKDMTKAEKIVYILIILFLVFIIINTYIKTKVFYDYEYIYDVVFTSDIGAIVRDNAFMNLYHIENDIRQPLFAVFAMPFMGIAYTLSLCFPFFYPISEGIFMAIIQSIMLLFANILLANLLKLKPKNRALFVALLMSCYMSILYTFVLEQYVVGYFWLIVCVYAICNNKQDSFVISGAGGTLLTSLFLALWVPKEFSFKKLKVYILNLIKIGLVFLYLFLIFGRFDAIMPETIETKQKLFTEFAGDDEEKKATLEDKLKQYTVFVENCFKYPKSEQLTRVRGEDYSFEAISVKPVKNYSYIGITLFALSLLGFILTRKEKISQIALAWVLFSFTLLGIIGWGSGENGMILYILYFGWSFAVLIYQLIKTICEKIKIKYLLTTVTVILVLACLAINYKGAIDLTTFGVNNYPASYESK